MIHLPSVKTFVYTIPKNVDRQRNISIMMNQLGFTNWEFVFGKEQNPYWMAIHQDFIEMLNTPVPFIILEDDVSLTDYYKPTIEYPSDANLVYLGGTRHGEFGFLDEIKKIIEIDNNVLIASDGFRLVPGCMIYTEYDNDYIRVYNMHSTHAMLFMDDLTKLDFQRVVEINRHIHVDMVFAYTMLTYKVYCLKHPFWHQNDGRNDDVTLNYYK
jgi:hypothetical protein